MPTAAPHVAIIGGGFSGTLTAIQLLRQTAGPIHIHLIERQQSRLWRGVAYSTEQSCHLLNVPAAGMSALPDDPLHFYRWAKAREASLVDPPWVEAVTEAAFLPRQCYGAYLQELFGHSLQHAAEGQRVDILCDEAVSLDTLPQGVRVHLRHNGPVDADCAVLALGNFPPADPPMADRAFLDSPRYCQNPWTPGVQTALLESRSCLIIGTGLTMLDLVMGLHQQRYQGIVHLISRRGLLPLPHATVAPFPRMSEPKAGSMRALTRHIKNLVAQQARTGGDWRAVIDALRPFSSALWQQLPIEEKKRFLRHVRPYWEQHRHRTAPVIHQTLQGMIAGGQILQHRGRIVGYLDSGDGVAVAVRNMRGISHIKVDAIVNCTGAECDFRKFRTPLTTDLLDKGLIQPDPLSFGLSATPAGELMNRHGAASRLFTLGPPQKGTLWETTAVPELRHQADRLAGTILRSLVVPVKGTLLAMS